MLCTLIPQPNERLFQVNQLERLNEALSEMDDAFAVIAMSVTMGLSDGDLVGVASSLAIARGHLISMRPTLMAEGAAAELEAAWRSILPEPKPQPGRRLKSGDVSCPTCKAKSGKSCFAMTKRGRYGEPTEDPAPKYHKTRVAKAKEASS